MSKKRMTGFNGMKLFGIVAMATGMGKLFTHLGFPETNIVVIYILAVLLVARFTSGYEWGIASSVISLLCYNYFFTVPYHTLQVDDPEYLITFFIMLVTSFLTSALTTKAKLSAMEANERGAETRILYMLSSKLSDASDMEAVLKIAVESLSHVFHANVGCIYVGRQFAPMYIQQVGEEQIHRSVNGVEELRGKYTNLRYEYVDTEEDHCFPVNGREQLLAILCIPKNVDEEQFEGKKHLLHSIIENVSMAMERIEITVERVRDRENMQRERERANLLRAISHDLRTPLSAIMGTSEMLMDMTEEKDPRQSLLMGIYRDADWLKSLVENILSMTRLQDGKIIVQKEEEAIEEIIGSAVAQIERTFPERNIEVCTPEDFRLVPMDAKLIRQVITNLLDNAIKHTTTEEKISVIAEYGSEDLVIYIQDEGEGIDEADLPNLFQIFYTSKTRSADVKRGIGLGLTICDTVIKAHGGKIIARNRTDGKGAEFMFTLPLTEDKKNV